MRQGGADAKHRTEATPRITVASASIESHTAAGDRMLVQETRTEASMLSVAMRDCQGDAPACEVCGTITVRNGTCYRCLNCGQSMGCS